MYWKTRGEVLKRTNHPPCSLTSMDSTWSVINIRLSPCRSKSMIIHCLASISLSKKSTNYYKSLAAVFHCEDPPYEASKLPRIVDSSVGAEDGAVGGSLGAGGGCVGRTYTLCGQNVYVSGPRRIRFTLETYTFSPPNVYVLLAIRIRPDEKGYTFGPCNR